MINNTTSSIDSARMAAADSQLGLFLITSSFITLFVVHVIFTRFFSSSSFKRDAHNNTFNTTANVVSLLSNPDSVLKREKVKESIAGYETLFAGARKEVGTVSCYDSIEHREREYKTMVNSFYDLVTDFYEWGWGQSFHFAPRLLDETFEQSILRAEYYLALRANIQPTSKVLDCGCGVGGPMRNIHQFTGADITGITINEYQAGVANKYCKQKNIDDKCRAIQGDFQKLTEKFEADQFDAAYEIEATCHSPNRRVCFKGIHHCLKKGSYFVGYEWVVLPGYDQNNPDHVRIKEGIEVGNGLPTLATTQEIVDDLVASGFEVVDVFDENKNVHSGQEVPWYQTLYGSFTLKGFRMTRLGRICTHTLVTTLEFLRIAPKGSAVRVSSLLNATALDLVEGGQKEIFTPSLCFVARKK